MKNKRNIQKIGLFIFILSSFYFNTISYASTEVYGENIGYGYIDVTYHSNYVGDHENEEYVIKHPIAIDSEGNKYITAGEDKFDEVLVDKKNTGFRGYTLSDNNSGTFWNETLSENIYLQGYKIYLSDLGFSEETTEETLYTANMYAQWQQSTVIYVYNASVTTAVLNTYNSSSAYNPMYESYVESDTSTWYFTTSNVVNGLTNAYSKLSTSGTIHTQYIVFLKTTSVSGTLAAKQATWAGKYNGLTYLSTSSGQLSLGNATLSADLRIRNIKLYNSKLGYIEGNIYAAGYDVYIDFGVVTYSGNVAYSKYELGSCCIAAFEGYVTSSAVIPEEQEILILSGHWVRISATRSKVISGFTFDITVGGQATVEIFCAGNAGAEFGNNIATLEVRDRATLIGMYGGHHGYNSMQEWQGTVTLNVEGNAYIHDLFGTGGGRYLDSSPIFRGTSIINIMGGKINNLYGGPAAGRVLAPSGGKSEIYINIKGGEIDNVYGGGYGYTYDPVYPLRSIHNYSGSVTGDIHITVENAIIGNLYGGGRGFNFYYDIDGDGINDNLKTTTLKSPQAAFKLSLSETGNAWHKGNTYITLNEGAIIEGNLYGAGEGYNDTVHVETARILDGIVDITINRGATVHGDVYGGGNNSYVKNTSASIKTINIKINSGTIDGFVYGGGNNANITGSIEILNDSSNIEAIYGGGNNGNVVGNCNIIVPIGGIGTIYGGGNNGDVTGNCNLELSSGTFGTVFGGGNLGKVTGNTEVMVGNDFDNHLTITDILYGGGRGASAEFETVTGSATVLIKGINSKVENYGSAKLGKVVGNVDVTFKDYWTGNTTNKYKIMNGIDRATNVYFENAYVLLENKDENGNLVGIKDIRNLYIPEGSGLKVSAEGEIAGDFHGGGTFCLDSEVCLTIGGNIYGKTILVLNPELTENGDLIKGSKDFPYMRIKGNDEMIGQALYSINPKYTMLRAVEDSGAIIYYIFKDIYITEAIDNIIQNIDGKHYSDDSNAWPEEDIYIINSGAFSSNCKLKIIYREDENIENKYKNVKRKLGLYTGDTLVSMPLGTNIVMIVDGELYKYRIESQIYEINLQEFVKMNDTTINFEEITDIRANATLTGDELDKAYEYNEEFRFIIDFSECSSDELLKQAPYNLIINFYDDGSISETTSNSINTIRIEELRKYDFEYSLDREWYNQDSKIVLDVKTKSDYYVLFNQAHKTKQLVGVVSIKDKNGNYQRLPYNLDFYLNGIKQEHTNGNMTYTVIDGLVQEAFEVDNRLTIDMSKVSVDEFLQLGENTINIKYYISKDGVLETALAEHEINFEVIKFNYYSMHVIVKPEDDMKESDLLKIIRNDDATRKLQIEYVGDLIRPYVEIKIQKEEAKVFNEIGNTITAQTIYPLETEIQQLDATFGNDLSAGTYKINFLLYDQYSTIRAEETLLFECE